MQNLEQITEQALDAIARAEDGKALDAIRVEYFGKGTFTALMQGLRDVSPEARPAVGQKINDAKQLAQNALNEKKVQLETAELNAQLAKEKLM